MPHDIPARGHDPPPEPGEVELPESLAKAQKVRRAMEAVGIELAEDNLLNDDQDEEWGHGLDRYDRLLTAAEERAVELAEERGT